MLHVYRVEFVREGEQLFDAPITTILHVRAEQRADVERQAAVVFEQVYGAAPDKLSFRLARVWSAG